MPVDSRVLRAHWKLNPEVTFLDHGSFGACPASVLEAQAQLTRKIERAPMRFFVEAFEPLQDAALVETAAFLGATPDDLAFVPSTITGVSTVLRSLDFDPNDELLTTNHVRAACRKELDYLAERTGARVVLAEVPLPTRAPDDVIDAVLARVSPRTRFAFIDQVTSTTALIFPVARLVAELAARGVDTLVDATHAPGMLSMQLDDTAAAYTTGSLCEWVCAPKGAAFLHVRRDRQLLIRPLAISHSATSPRLDRSRFRLEFDWTGTVDPTPFLCVPQALHFLGALLPGGVTGWMERNREAALEARRTLCTALGVEPLCPNEMVGAMASVPLPLVAAHPTSGAVDSLQEELFERFKIDVAIFPSLAPTTQLMRVSTPAYVTPTDVARLVSALVDLGIARRQIAS